MSRWEKTRMESRAGTRRGTGASTTRPRIEAFGFDRSGTASPAESLSTNTTNTKRKQRDFELEEDEGTNISVVVRCRGRNEREVLENGAVVVETDGVKGRLVKLSMGPNALSNRMYNFDRVFSPAADQSMIFDDVVKPILDDVLTGYNCTIFAYGQTGTGKTYTMSGDMNETMGLLSDAAGIIPRVLHALFSRLGDDDCVKCSFIELYNEELRDLIAVEGGPKLKIYNDMSRKGHATTVVQGVEEKHIKTTAEGIKVLQDGSLKRQVAATKCNDLSSRSHTVFTITAYVRVKGEDGAEDYVSARKLNLVDLAGSENIQRSGADNKRATEAGLINKSLLTLGRVINALVDRNQHIPYRESKLTRLLQDSLGGRTKTCIIATISPAKSNLEETTSTLDYAFRAKNICNKPRLNAVMNKEMLLKDFATEIEKLKKELIATRQRNGVYLSHEAYEEMMTKNESLRIVMEEQAAKMEAVETSLKNKVQELFTLATTLAGLKKDYEGTKAELDKAKDVLDQTELALDATRKALAEETHIRKAYQQTEEKLTGANSQLISTIQKAARDVGVLHAKNDQMTDLHSTNRSTWGMSQAQVSEVTSLVEQRVEEFHSRQHERVSHLSKRMETFVRKELQTLSSMQTFLDEHLQSFADPSRQLLEQVESSKDGMGDVLEEINIARATVKQQVSESLHAIAGAVERMTTDVLSELGTFHGQLHTSYSSLSEEFTTVFEDLVKHITLQRSESDRLRRQLQSATSIAVEQNANISVHMQQVLEEERKQSAEDRQNLLLQITSLINAHAEDQESRLAGKTAQLQQSVLDSKASLASASVQYTEGMDVWDKKESRLLDDMARSRDAMKIRLEDDWTTASERSTSIQAATKSVHTGSVRMVDKQLKDLDVQMEALEDFVTRASSVNVSHHERHAESMQGLFATVEHSVGNISSHFKTTLDRVKDLGDDMEKDTGELQQSLEPLVEQLCQPLSELRENVATTALQEYQPTDSTPEKAQYHYPTNLPKTEVHETPISDIHNTTPLSKSSAVVFADLERPGLLRPPRVPVESMISERRPFYEVNHNLTTNLMTRPPTFYSPASSTSVDENTVPLLFKRSSTGHQQRGRKRETGMVPLVRPGNVPPTAFSQSLGPRRKSPRFH